MVAGELVSHPQRQPQIIVIPDDRLPLVDDVLVRRTCWWYGSAAQTSGAPQHVHRPHISKNAGLHGILLDLEVLSMSGISKSLTRWFVGLRVNWEVQRKRKFKGQSPKTPQRIFRERVSLLDKQFARVCSTTEPSGQSFLSDPMIPQSSAFLKVYRSWSCHVFPLFAVPFISAKEAKNRPTVSVNRSVCLQPCFGGLWFLTNIRLRQVVSYQFRRESF